MSKLVSSDGVEYSTTEYQYEYRKKLRAQVQVLILKNALEYEYRKIVQIRVRVGLLLQNLAKEQFLSCNSSKFVAKTQTNTLFQCLGC